MSAPVPGALEVPEVPARLVFMDGSTGEARARVLGRTARWRRTSAARELLWLLLVPIVVWAPPHIPWVLLVVGVAFFRAFARLREHGTLLSLRGTCPKCGTEQDFPELGRIKEPHLVHCANCQWELRVLV